MKIYIVQEISYIYDDSNYTRADQDQSSTKHSGEPQEAYRSEEKAQAACYRKNKAAIAERGQEYGRYEGDKGLVTDFFEVIELEVADEEVEASAETMEDMKAAQGKLNEKKKKLLIATLKSESAKLFDKYPEMQSYSWHQLTSSEFNDGDPNYFQVYADEYDIVIDKFGKKDDDGDYEEDELPKWVDKAREDCSKLVREFETGDLELVYGDGFRIEVKRDGKIKVSDYYE